VADAVGYAPERTFSRLTIFQIRSPRPGESDAARLARLCRTFDLVETEAALLVGADATLIDTHGRVTDSSSWNR
jgi:hypothetical protein